MNTEPNFALILTVGLACVVAVSIAAVVLMQIRPRFNLRNLGVAFSAACGIACLLLLALWVRSYWRCDVMVGDEGNYGLTFFGSDGGTVYLIKDFSLGLLPGIGRSRTTFQSGEASKNLASFQWTPGRRTLIRIP